MEKRNFIKGTFNIGAIQHPKIMGNNMPMVPSQLWNVVHDNIPDEVKQDKEGLKIITK